VPPYVITEEGGEEVAAELSRRLRQFNERSAGPLNIKRLVLTTRDEADTLIAGLLGEFFWNTLFVGVLWVDELHRGKKLGRSLLERAERLAAERLCDSIYLSTFSFQAPEFYAKRGYKQIGSLDGSPKGHERYWFAKLLGKSAV